MPTILGLYKKIIIDDDFLAILDIFGKFFCSFSEWKDYWISFYHEPGFYLSTLESEIHKSTFKIKRPEPNNGNRKYIIKVDGTFYNLRQLKEKLNVRNDKSSLSEIILNIICEKGLEGLKDLEGDFAIAIYDIKGHSLFLLRDPFGVRPLYFAHLQDCIIFSSLIKPFLLFPQFKAQVDFRSLYDFFAFQQIFDDKTIFKNIKILKPGHLYAFNGKELKISKFFEVNLTPSPFESEDIQRFTDELLKLLTRSIKKRISGIRSLGCHLSGGIDSSAISVIAAKNRKQKIKTCSGVYPYGPAYDESPLARMIAAKIQSEHLEIYPLPKDIPENLEKIIYFVEEPRGMVTLFSRFMVAKNFSKKVKVVLHGQGADEIFGGYPWYLEKVNMEDLAKYFVERRIIFTDNWLSEVLADDFIAELKKEYSSYNEMAKILDIPNNPDLPWLRMRYFDFKHFLPHWLILEDKISRAYNTEVRYPFLDLDLIKFANKLPPHFLVCGNQIKKALKFALKGLLPNEILNAPKIGFRTPFGEMLREGLKDYVYQILLDDQTLKRGYYQKAGIENLLEKHFSGQSNYGWQIWGLLFWEIWNRLFASYLK